jgi:flagellin
MMIQNLFSSAASAGAISPAVFDQAQRVQPPTRLSEAQNEPAVLTTIDPAAHSERTGMRAVNGGMSIVQSVDGAADQVQEGLVRMRKLAVVAASDTPGEPDRATLLEQTEKLKEEINAIADETAFSGFKLTDGSQAHLEIQVNPVADDVISIDTPDLSTESLGVDLLDLSTTAGAKAALAALDAAISSVGRVRVEAGFQQEQLAEATRESVEAQDNPGARTISDTESAVKVSQEANVQLREERSAAAQVQTQNLSRATTSILLA